MARRKNRIFTRPGPDGTLLYYGDFRDLGGGREALKPSGQARGRATTDPDVAEALCAARVEELLKKKHAGERQKVGIEALAAPGLKSFAALHLTQKAKAGKVTESWLARTEEKLKRAVEFFGAQRQLDTIEVADLQGYLNWLQERPGRRGNKALSGGTLRHHLNALSNLYRRAQAEKVVPPGYNPVAFLLEKPSAQREEAAWLEVHEAALLLESARTYTPPEDSKRGLPFMHALIATYLLTGGRTAEVLGLEVRDINFQRHTVTFRQHEHRRLKTLTSHRTVPLFPQLAEILRAHIKEQKTAGGLLFPSPNGNGMIVDFRKQLDTIAERAGWQEGEIRSKAFRHTYCASRLQTLDGGAPISPYTVARELGHGGDVAGQSRIRPPGHRAAPLGGRQYGVEIIQKLKDAELKQEFGRRLKALNRAGAA